MGSHRGFSRFVARLERECCLIRRGSHDSRFESGVDSVPCVESKCSGLLCLRGTRERIVIVLLRVILAK